MPQKHSGPEPETGGTKHTGVAGAEPHREQLRAVATATGGVHHADAGPAAASRGAHEGREAASGATAAAKTAASRPAPASATASGNPHERAVATSTFALQAAPGPPAIKPAAPATSHYDATGGQAAASSAALAPTPAVGQPGVLAAGGKVGPPAAQKMGTAEAPAGQAGLPTTATAAAPEGAEAGTVGAKMRLPSADFVAALGLQGRASLSPTVSNTAVESQGAAGAR